MSRNNLNAGDIKRDPAISDFNFKDNVCTFYWNKGIGPFLEEEKAATQTDIILIFGGALFFAAVIVVVACQQW